jgi:nicotinamidase-related amidase
MLNPVKYFSLGTADTFRYGSLGAAEHARFKDLTTVVLLNDMQDFFLEDINPRKVDSIIDTQIRVLETCREKDIPVVDLGYDSLSKTRSELREVVRRVPRHDDVRKEKDNGFERTNLYDILKGWNVGTCFLMGINAGGCIISSADGALENRLRIATSEDVIANPSDKSIVDAKNWFEKHGRYFRNYQEFLRACA